MPLLRSILLLIVLAIIAAPAHSQDGKIAIEKFNHSAWTKGIFSEAVTVTGVGNAKFIYLAGVGAEDENGARGDIRHHGNFLEQCKYAYDKIRRALAAHGGTLADAVKQVVYVTDIRYQAAVGKCRSEAYAGMPIPANTFLVISGLAIQGMLLEIDVTAVVPK